MTFSATNLPGGLKLDPATGQITGMIPGNATTARRDFDVVLHAHNALGDASRPLKIVAGGGIGLTPPMGWNSWNCFAAAVTQADVTAAADALVKSGLADHGWNYINVDGYWQVNPSSNDPTLHGPERDKDGGILSNPRFPSMKALAAHIHSLGLKAGLYSSPGPVDCGAISAAISTSGRMRCSSPHGTMIS